MNFWTKGIAVVKNVFGGSTLSADKVFTSVAKGIDNLGFTEQERATFTKDMAEGLAKYTIDTLGESSDRSKTRRDIAIMIVSLYLLTFIVALVMLLMSKDLTSVKMIIELANEMNLSIGFLMVLGFFFGGYYLQNLIGKKK